MAISAIYHIDHIVPIPRFVVDDVVVVDVVVVVEEEELYEISHVPSSKWQQHHYRELEVYPCHWELS